jgi:Family of unknown function (DUF5984)
VNFKVGFKLTNLDELLGVWSDTEQLLGGLYWLSLGWYWLELGGEVIPQAHPDWVRKYPEYDHPPGIDYQVLRFFADIGETTSYGLKVISRPLASALEQQTWQLWTENLDKWRKDVEGDAETFFEDIWNVSSWWHNRIIDTGYLRAGPSVHFWSPDDVTVSIGWDTQNAEIEGVQTMLETSGQLSLNRTAFIAELHRFRDDLEVQLAERIQQLNTLGLIDALGVKKLSLQLDKWMGDFNADLSRVPDDEDDALILASIQTLEPIIGPLF